MLLNRTCAQTPLAALQWFLCTSILLTGCSLNHSSNGRNDHYVSNRAPLTQSPLVDLPAGSIQAKGWLAEQLRLQAEGVTGHLDALFDDVGPESAWLGGDGEDWERGPYYIRGATALAYATGDERMIAKVRPWIEWTLNSQKSDGYFGPDAPTSKTKQGDGYNDWWSRMIMLQILQIHHEATHDPRVIPFMTNYFRYQLSELPKRPLRSWGYKRGGDNLYSIHWLYNRTGEPFLLELGDMVYQQTHDWTGQFLREEYLKFHVVNLSQAYKQPGVRYQQSHDPRHMLAVYRGIERAMEQHGRIDGMHSGDEGEAGKSATRGTELCAVVEYMHSLETLIGILGDPGLADTLERVSFNALPAMLKPDLRGRQYFSQPNQVLCTREKHGFSTDHGDDLTLGVLTGYACCATNMHMGWPMLVNHLWMATPDNGLATIVYAPSVVTARVGHGEGTRVRITTHTQYPFRDKIMLEVRPDRPARFPLHVRIPGWCNGATIEINREPGPVATPGTFVKLKRTWTPGDVVTLTFPMRTKFSTWENNSTGVERGPLAFALAVEEDWRKFPDWRRGDVEDEWPQWEVHPKSDWNYGLIIDKTSGRPDLMVQHRPVPDQPWSPEGSPIKLIGRGKKIADWGLNEHRNAAPPPQSPATTDAEEEQVTLLPFGATRLRVAYIPTIAE